MNTKELKLHYPLEYNKCTGCGACAEICSQDAIILSEDAEGFLIPNYKQYKCIDCNLCDEVCPSYNNQNAGYSIYDALALNLRLKDSKALRRSASGGAFYGIAKEFIDKKQGHVFGASFDGQCKVYHREVTDLEELHVLQNSKYVQSDMSMTFTRIKEILRMNRYVLFSGTPCQIAALKCYLKKDYDNLYTIDILCHGVSNHKLLKEEADVLDSSGIGLESILFRLKGRCSKSYYYLLYRFRNKGYVILNERQSLFYKLFFEGSGLRESCYSCLYAKPERKGDITIGDCSTADIELDFFPHESTSAVFINTEKGIKLWKDAKELFFYKELNSQIEIKLNHPLRNPTLRPENRDKVFYDIATKGYRNVMETNCEGRSLKSSLLMKKRLMFPSLSILLKKASKSNSLIRYMWNAMGRVYHVLKCR